MPFIASVPVTVYIVAVNSAPVSLSEPNDRTLAMAAPRSSLSARLCRYRHSAAEPIVQYGQKVPRLRITFIPVNLPGQEPLSLDPDVIVRGIHAYWPAADDIDATVAPAFESDASNQYELLQEVRAMWNAEADPNEFYYGIFAQPWTGGRGAAYRSGRVAVSELSEYNTIPNEFGHNLNLRHLPGCKARSIDRNYPNPDGQLGPLPLWDAVWHRALSGDDPTYADVMSYCGSYRLISDFHYRKAWQNRRASAPERPAAASPTIHWSRRSWIGPVEPVQNEQWGTERPGSLVLTGRIDEQVRWTLTHAQASSRGARAPAPGGAASLGHSVRRNKGCRRRNGAERFPSSRFFPWQAKSKQCWRNSDRLA